MKSKLQVEFKKGDKVRFTQNSIFKANNTRGPFTVGREPTVSDPDHLVIRDAKGILFTDGGEGLWHRGHFELV